MALLNEPYTNQFLLAPFFKNIDTINRNVKELTNLIQKSINKRYFAIVYSITVYGDPSVK